MISIYAALEIGTKRTVLAVGEAEQGERLRVTSLASIPSGGVRKSLITDLANASRSVRSVLHEVENDQLRKGSHLTIGNAYLVVNGQHIKADSFTGTAQIARDKVSREDIDEVVASAHSMTLPRERVLLDIVDGTYSVDDFTGVTSPKGMSGRILRLGSLHIHADANRVNDAKTAAGEAHLEIKDSLFAATCAADAVLSEAERSAGALVLDLGAGSTGYALYDGGVLVAAGVLGVGCDHITNDIATAFQTTQGQAEMLKTAEASALLGGSEGASPRVGVPGASPLMEQRTLSRHALNTVVNARCREMADMVREALEEAEMLYRLHGGIILTGGGAQLSGLPELLKRELGAEVRIGEPQHVDGLEDFQVSPCAAAEISGALMYAQANSDDGGGMMKSLFGGLFK